MNVFEYFFLLCSPVVIGYAAAIIIHILTKEKKEQKENERIN